MTVPLCSILNRYDLIISPSRDYLNTIEKPIKKMFHYETSFLWVFVILIELFIYS